MDRNVFTDWYKNVFIPSVKKRNHDPEAKHTLEEGDEAIRLDFCLEMGNRILDNVGFHKRILFSEESTFSANGVVSSQHCRPNSRENLGDGPGDQGSWSTGSSGSIYDIRFVVSDPKKPPSVHFRLDSII
ncbi:hypothetical protein NQ318_020839 [Aromia moschata]|uniref:Uncharacterized protein n=1 Tax=Aromia moschata TaxID=1265417 RepID=A0AAV8Y8U8_9CUCU|nr:hypothetical protein NQ318_020839 [Aromia moschata]